MESADQGSAKAYEEKIVGLYGALRLLPCSESRILALFDAYPTLKPSSFFFISQHL